MEKLKACPFCGEEYAHDFDGVVYCAGKCRDDGSLVKIPVKTWQSRPVENALNARISELESALKTMRHILYRIEDPYPYLGEDYEEIRAANKKARMALNEPESTDD